jgi:hypothetical protein
MLKGRLPKSAAAGAFYSEVVNDMRWLTPCGGPLSRIGEARSMRP